MKTKYTKKDKCSKFKELLKVCYCLLPIKINIHMNNKTYYNKSRIFNSINSTVKNYMAITI